MRGLQPIILPGLTLGYKRRRSAACCRHSTCEAGEDASVVFRVESTTTMRQSLSNLEFVSNFVFRIFKRFHAAPSREFGVASAGEACDAR